MSKRCLKLITSILILAFILGCCLTLAKANIVFQDDFGSGNFNSWTVTGSPAIVTKPVSEGSKYTAQFPSTSSNASNSYIQAPFPKTNTATLEFYFQTDTITENFSTICFAAIMSNASSIFVTLNRLTNGSLTWAFVYPSTNGSSDMKIILSTVQTDVWYKFGVAVAVSAAAGTIQFSINSSPVFTVSEPQFNWDPTVFNLGTVVSKGYSDGHIYIDDVSVTDTANIVESTSASPTPASNPSSQSAPEFSTLTAIALFTVLSVSAVIIFRAPLGSKRHKVESH
jgi:hypothetical protein